MKKINMVVVCLLDTSLTVAGCASTPQSEAYLQTPIGNGSESGFVMTATLPDGTTREMHLFKTWQEMDAFTTEIGFERTSWHMKFDASLLQTAKFSAKNAKFNEEGYLAEPYSFDEIGEIGKVMKEKELHLSVYADKIGKEWRTVGVVAQDKKYTNFRFSIIDYIDKETYQARIAAERAERDEKISNAVKGASQSIMSIAETSARMKEEQKKQEQANAQRQRQINEDLARQSKEQIQRQTQNRQTNQKNSSNYHDKNKTALSNYFNQIEASKGSSNALNRSSSVTSAELARYEQLIENGLASSSAAQQVYNEFRK